MDIQVNTDNHIKGSERFTNYVHNVVEGAVTNFRDQISHVGVHVSDQNSSKIGFNDKRCTMEARIIGRKTTAVTHDADSVDEAVMGAAEKIKHSIEHTLGKNRN